MIEENERDMAADSKPVQRNPSRWLAIGAVVVLIVIAIAGIMLAGRHPPPALGTAAALPDVPVVAPTPQAPAAPTPPGPNEVLFTAGTGKLPAEASDRIAKFAEGARKAAGAVRLTARVLTGANKTKDLELAKTRTAAVRHALESNGVKPEQMQIEMIEMPAGTLSARDAEIVEMSLP